VEAVITTGFEARARYQKRIDDLLSDISELTVGTWRTNDRVVATVRELEGVIERYRGVLRLIPATGDIFDHGSLRGESMASRPLGLLIIWKMAKEPNKWTLIKSGLFGHYQNGVDYLNDFAQVHGFKEAASVSGVLAYEKGDYRLELSLSEAQGLDLSKETYLFQETANAEAQGN